MARGTLSRFIRDRRGGVITIFVVAAPVLAMSVGAVMEYANLELQRTRLQKAVDYAAVTAARELGLSNARDSVVAGTAAERVRASMAPHAEAAAIDARAAVTNARRSVDVDAVLQIKGLMAQLLSWPSGTVSARATGTLVGQTQLCILGLAPSYGGTISVEKNSKITATQCSVYSNSTAVTGVHVKDVAYVDASSVCSAGGFLGVVVVNFPRLPRTGCPAIPDPLAGQAAPATKPCDFTNVEVKGRTQTLTPGVYCNGLKITGGANVTLSKGIYVVEGGPLTVDGNSTLQGDYVGIYLRGSAASLKFEKDSTISLSAPKNEAAGVMNGMLVFEDRTASEDREHVIKSGNARRLLGTIYLPRGRLKIETDKPVADQSAYTVIVAKQLVLKDGPNLVMNAMYAQSDVPVPDGVGPNGGVVSLTR